MKITVSSRAEKRLRRMPKIDQMAVGKKIRLIRNDETVVKTEKLKGYKNIHRVRVGQYRVVYREKTQEIYIILIGHRKDVYRDLKQMFR